MVLALNVKDSLFFFTYVLRYQLFIQEVEVVIRGKVKLGTSQQLIAINDLLGNVIISTDESNK